MKNAKKTLGEAASILNSGGIVIFPTDTAYGMGCRIDKIKAIKRLFEIRKRPTKMAFPILVSSKQMALDYYSSPIPDNVRHLLESNWPGALTVVYRSNLKKVSPLLRGGRDSVGIRMPADDFLLGLIEKIGVPLIGTSANFHRGKTPFRYQDLNQDLVKLTDYVVYGKCKLNNVSTVIDCTQRNWRILRQGAVLIDKKMKNAGRKRKISLFIDTSDNKIIRLALEKDKKELDKLIVKNKWSSQILLPSIIKLLKRNRLEAADISKININKGPGSYTGLRVGISVANILGWLLGIPVNNQKKMVLPKYE